MRRPSSSGAWPNACELRPGRLLNGRLTSAIALVVMLAALPSLLASPGRQAAAGSEREALVRACLDDINRERYDSVFDCAQTLSRRFPDSAAGPFVTATAYQTMMSDYRVRRFEREFEGAIAVAIAKAKASVEREPTPENHFLWGAAESYRCVYWFRQGKWLSAVRSARRSIGRLEQAHRLDPGFADPLLGLALYDHTKAKVRLLGIGLFADRRTRAVERLTVAHRQGRYVSVNALYAMQDVLMDEGRSADALEPNDRLFVEFPHNPVVLYNRGLILERLGRLDEAKQDWTRLIDIVGAFVQPSQGFLAECHYHLALLARQRGHYAAAAELVARAMTHADRRQAAVELDGPYGDFNELRQAIARSLREWGVARVNQAGVSD